MVKVKKTKTEEKKAKTPKTIEVVKTTAEDLLLQLQIEASVEVVDAGEGIFNANVSTEESGLLIGFHGETLSSFQLILGLIIYRKLGSWVKVVVEVGDYRAKRAETITAMALSYAAQVVSTGQPIVMPPLPPSERRVVHLALQDNPDVVSESEGEGNFRRVVIKPKGAI